MVAGFFNLYVEGGATFSKLAQAFDEDNLPIDFTGYDTLRAELRDKPLDEGGKLVATATPTWDDQTLGIVRIYMSPAVTGAIGPNDRNGVWDLEVEDGAGDVVRVLQGKYTLDPQVTD